MAVRALKGTRSDGERTRRDILQTAARLATVEGIRPPCPSRDLAARVGMSKSGLYAHFGSKEELQLATVDTAKAVFEEVVRAGPGAHPMGREGPIALTDALLEHIRDEVYPGGCFFDATAAELQPHPGPVRDAVNEVPARWRQLASASTSMPPRPLETSPPNGTSTSSTSTSSGLPDPRAFAVPDRGRRPGDRPPPSAPSGSLRAWGSRGLLRCSIALIRV